MRVSSHFYHRAGRLEQLDHLRVFFHFIIEVITWKIKQMLKSLSCISQTGRFTKPLLKSLSCISQNQYWKHFHVFHLGKSLVRIRPTEQSVYFSTPPSFFFTKLTMQSQKKMNFPMPLHRKHCKEEATVVTQFWIHQDFLECILFLLLFIKIQKN